MHISMLLNPISLEYHHCFTVVFVIYLGFGVVHWVTSLVFLETIFCAISDDETSCEECKKRPYPYPSSPPNYTITLHHYTTSLHYTTIVLYYCSSWFVGPSNRAFGVVQLYPRLFLALANNEPGVSSLLLSSRASRRRKCLRSRWRIFASTKCVRRGKLCQSKAMNRTFTGVDQQCCNDSTPRQLTCGKLTRTPILMRFIIFFRTVPEVLMTF